MKKSSLLIAVLLLCIVNSWAQINDGKSEPRSFTTSKLSVEVPQVELQPLDMASIQEENQKRDSKGILQFNTRIQETSINNKTQGLTERLTNGDQIWRMRIQAPQAKALTLYFKDFNIPQGAKLYIYNSAKTQIIGGFTHANNHESGFFATEAIYSDDIIVGLG